MTNFVLMGDVHSVFSRFERALSFIQNNIEDYHLVMLGDVFDSRCDESDSVSIYRTIRELQEHQKVTLIQSNHQWKLQRYLRGNNVKVDEPLQKTINDFASSDVTSQELLEWLEALPFAAAFQSNGVEYRCAHAYFSTKLYVPMKYENVYTIQEVSRQMRDKLIYGILDSNRSRIEWWNESSEREWIRCAGHYHRVAISQENRSIVLDSSCGCNEGTLSIFDVTNQVMHQF